MATRAVGFRIAQTLDDVALGAHATGNNTKITSTRTDSTLASDIHVGAKVVLDLQVVMMCIDRFGGQLKLYRDMPAQRRDHRSHHDSTIFTSIVLRPTDRFDVVSEFLGTIRQICQVTIRQRDEEPFHQALGLIDKVTTNRVANTTATRMQHDPHRALFVQAQLDKVVARAQGAQLAMPLPGFQVGMLCEQLASPSAQGLREHRQVFLVSTTCAQGHVALDLQTHITQAIRQVFGAQASANRVHAAANIHTHSRRDHSMFSRYHRAHRRANTSMHVGHQGHAVFVNEGQLSQLASLLKSLQFNILRPDLYRYSQFVAAHYLFDGHRYSFLVTFGYHMQQKNVEQAEYHKNIRGARC